jgi:hypothetical protein
MRFSSCPGKPRFFASATGPSQNFDSTLSFHVNVRRLALIRTEEDEAIWAILKYSRHSCLSVYHCTSNLIEGFLHDDELPLSSSVFSIVRCQIVLLAFCIHQQHKQAVLRYSPIIDHSHSAALTSSSCCPPRFAKPTTTYDDRPHIRACYKCSL